MRKHLLALFLFLTLFSLFSSAQQTPQSQPDDLLRARHQYLDRLHTATEPIRKSYIQTLERLKRQYAIKGDLATATLVQQEIDAILKDSITVPSLHHALAGTTWEYGDQTFEFSTDMTVNHPGWKAKGWDPAWAVTGPNEATITFRSGKRRGQKATFVFSPDCTSYTGTNFGGGELAPGKRK